MVFFFGQSTLASYHRASHLAQEPPFYNHLARLMRLREILQIRQTR